MTKRSIDCALVIVDMQNDFVMPGSPIRIAGAKATVPAIKKLLKAFRDSGLPVFHVIREYRPDGSDIEITRLDSFLERSKVVVPGTKGCEIIDELRPMPGEYKIVKNRYSGFFMTELDLVLRRLGIEEIVVCGTELPSCVRTTVFDAISYNYITTVVEDGCSSQTPEINEANLRDIRNIGVDCLTSAEIIKLLHGK